MNVYIPTYHSVGKYAELACFHFWQYPSADCCLLILNKLSNTYIQLNLTFSAALINMQSYLIWSQMQRFSCVVESCSSTFD